MNGALLLLTALLLPAALALTGLAAGLLLRRMLERRLSRAGRATPSPIAGLVAGPLGGPVVVWTTITALYVAAEVAALPPGVGRVVRQTLLVLVILSVTWALAGVAGALVARAAARARGALPSSSLITNLARITVLAVGILIALQALNISITPLITALGVGGLAVGLALQETLANLFAGIHIVTSRQIRPGDFVRLSSGEEGYVQDVTWRYTTIRQLPNNVTIVPNAKLASAVTTNYYLPERELAVLVDVAVSYDSDPEQVERVTIDVARQVQRTVLGGVA